MAGPITNTASNSEASDKHIVPTWFLLLGLLLGVVASVVGYIGCFSVVQSTQKSTGPLSWLCLEAALSLLRMYIWSLNPQCDDAPPLEIVLALDHDPPLPTCNKYSKYIEEDKVLPLTRADQFLNSVTPFAGLIDRFEHPDLTLYYALTRQEALVTETETTLGKWVLYIDVFDHKERTARVYTRGDTPDGFRAIESSIPAIDLEHGVLQAELGEIIDIEHDPILGVGGIRTRLEDHYQSIMGPYSTMTEKRKYCIETRWTMKRVDTTSAAHNERGTGTLGGGASTVKPSHEATLRDTWERDRQYLEQGRVERMLGELYTRRGKWVENYMALVMRETRESFKRRGTVKRVDWGTGGGEEKTVGGGFVVGESDEKVVIEDQEELENLLIEEWRWMEMLLVYEVERWEAQLLERCKHFIGGSPEQQRLTREWRGNCWQRFDASIRAMDARIEAAKTKANSNEFDVFTLWKRPHNDIQRAWKAPVERFMDSETSSSSPSMPLQRLEERLARFTKLTCRWVGRGVEQLNKQCEEMASRFRRELEDVEERLNQGLDHCDQFWVDEALLKCKHSRSRTLILEKPLTAPLEVYSRALKQTEFIRRMHIIFSDFDSDDDRRRIAIVVRDLRSLISIRTQVLDPNLLRMRIHRMISRDESFHI